MSENIAGTRVPDNALHRASLWLEDTKGTRDGKIHGYTAEDVIDELGKLSEACKLGASGAELHEGVQFYAENLRRMIFGGKVSIGVMTPAGLMDIGSIFESVWLDGFQHGAATAAGKRGQSNEEILRAATS